MSKVHITHAQLVSAYQPQFEVTAIRTTDYEHPIERPEAKDFPLDFLLALHEWAEKGIEGRNE